MALAFTFRTNTKKLELKSKQILLQNENSLKFEKLLICILLTAWLLQSVLGLFVTSLSPKN